MFLIFCLLSINRTFLDDIVVMAEPNPPREATLSVHRDNGNKVTLTIGIPGLHRKKSLWKYILNLFSKPSDPFRLSSNASFTNYNLTNGSLDFSVDVYENKQALRDHSEVRQTYFVKIEQFPSRINPESATFEVRLFIDLVL